MRCRTAAAALLMVLVDAEWYDGIDGIKVLHPEDAKMYVMNQIWWRQDSQNGHFNEKRYAVLLLPGKYPENFHIPVSYYTSVIGVGENPYKVELEAVSSTNGDWVNGQTTDNFWRSFEGVMLTNESITWAVSQGAPIRRSVVRGGLMLSDPKGGYSSGGFIADSTIEGTLSTGSQQQFFFRNTEMKGGIWCHWGLNYVFVGVGEVSQDTFDGCAGNTPAKVTVVESTPRVAEKPYLVLEDGGAWKIFVPAFSDGPQVGSQHSNPSNIDRKLDLASEVFIMKPEHSIADVLAGIEGKRGLLVTPGVWELDTPIVVKDSGFVILGLGFATLVTTGGLPAIRVEDGVEDVRIAGLILEAGTEKTLDPTEPLLQWGTSPAVAGKKGSDTGYAGVLSDIFARVGSFRYRECPVVKVDNMIEINSDGVVTDNLWMWHADHDDCNTDIGDALDMYGKSDDCYSKHGLVVNGDRVTAYATFSEHSNGGNLLQWNGEDGELYFYQSELPYHHPEWGTAGNRGFAVAPNVRSFRAWGLGVYIIGGNMKAKSAIVVPPTAKIENMVTVVIEGDGTQYENLLCVKETEDEPEVCYPAEECEEACNRCVMKAMPEKYLNWVIPSQAAVPEAVTTEAPLTTTLGQAITSAAPIATTEGQASAKYVEIVDEETQNEVMKREMKDGGSHETEEQPTAPQASPEAGQDKKRKNAEQKDVKKDVEQKKVEQKTGVPENVEQTEASPEAGQDKKRKDAEQKDAKKDVEQKEVEQKTGVPENVEQTEVASSAEEESSGPWGFFNRVRASIGLAERIESSSSALDESRSPAWALLGFKPSGLALALIVCFGLVFLLQVYRWNTPWRAERIPALVHQEAPLDAGHGDEAAHFL